MTLGLVTSAYLDQLPEVPGLRYEIIDGELYVSRQPTLGHQRASGRAYRAVDEWSERTGLGEAFNTPGLVLANDEDVVPDVVWVSRARLAEAQDERGHLQLAPELVIEVLSPGPVNEARDRQIKLALYARQGVEEYWVVDWLQHLVEVFRRSVGGLELAARLGDGDILKSPLLPGFTLTASTLWAERFS